MVYERLNGQLMHIYPISLSGNVYNAIPSGKALKCVAVLGAYSVAIVLSDFSVITVARSALSVINYCKV